MESELIASDITCTETEWIKSLLMDMPMVEKPLPALSIHYDYKATIDLRIILLTNPRNVEEDGLKPIRESPRNPRDVLMVIPMTSVLYDVTLGGELSLNEFRGKQSPARCMSHVLLENHLSERHCKAATMRIGLFSTNSHENQD
ncbi:unnamed protein product [Prunus armeniaca]